MPKEQPTHHIVWFRPKCSQENSLPFLCSLPHQGQTAKRSPRGPPRLPPQGLTSTGNGGEGAGKHTDQPEEDTPTDRKADSGETAREPIGATKQIGPKGNHTSDLDSGETVNEISSNIWEPQASWVYAGHGEWIQADSEQDTKNQGNMLQHEPDLIKQWWASHDEDVKLNAVVRREGYPNRWGAKQEVKSRWNLHKFAELLHNYEDKEIVQWLCYGWPVGRLPTLPDPQLVNKNHKGANEFPEALQKYLEKEKSYEAVMGPFNKLPFKDRIGISPLSTRPKKGSTDRRVILDLSFPIGCAVNDGIPKDSYMGFTAELTFPKTDDFAVRIHELGPG